VAILSAARCPRERRPAGDLASAAWSSLPTRRLENRPFEALHVELATQLIVRGSTGVPASG
jgi:hypothetical protein